jgi:hypothetical protein
MLAASEVQIASLRARVASIVALQPRTRMLKTAPQVEAEAAQLNRDYAINKKNYEDLVARRQSAADVGRPRCASGVADFPVDRPPRVSPKPVSPNRLLLLPTAFLVALGAGLPDRLRREPAASGLRARERAARESPPARPRHGLPCCQRRGQASRTFRPMRFLAVSSMLFVAFIACWSRRRSRRGPRS